MNGFHTRVATALVGGVMAMAATAMAENESSKSAGKDDCKIFLDIDGESGGVFGGIFVDGLLIEGPGEFPSDRGAREHKVTLSPVIVIEEPLRLLPENEKAKMELDINISAECNIELGAPFKVKMGEAEFVSGGSAGQEISTGGSVTVKGAIVNIN